MFDLSRRLARSFLALTLLTSPALALDPIQLNWLDKAAPASPVGTSFGVPFAQGAVAKGTTFALQTGDNKPLPLQAWPLAYWPDGSIKWQGFATTAATPGPFSLITNAPPAANPIPPMSAVSANSVITITNGQTVYLLNTSGPNLINSIKIGDREIATSGHLVASEFFGPDKTPRPFHSEIASATVEQSGPLRAVVKFEGKYGSAERDVNKAHTPPIREWLPFTVRLYFYAGQGSVKVVHSFVFDGDQEKDFIKSLGIRFTVPLREQPFNRHVRFAGDTGMFQEPIQPVVGRRVQPVPPVQAHVQGQPLDLDQPLTTAPPGRGASPALTYINQMAIWDSFKFNQLSPDGWELTKQTNAQSAPIRITAGKRSPGLAFLGDTTGGIALGLKNFWQMYPTAFEVSKASTSSGELTLWLYSPDAPPMDMRHYDTKEHGLEAAYEDITPGLSTATGVARTHEMTLTPYVNVPTAETLWGLAQATAKTPLLVATPQYLHSVRAFGIWSIPDRSNPNKAAIEDELDKALAFYQGQIEERRWYSFWDFGDVMHSYDPSRHEWRYDIGGYAWANTELMPDMWLWYSFLRTGRADIFRMAEAMTRQTQEVDVYHLGELKGLGSRHNVRHWGDGAKELRVSQAALKRFYYYLTTDERTGDLMMEVVDADQAILKTDILRKVEEDRKYPTHVRAGPDWYSLCSNWLTAYERTGDKQYLDRVLAGVKSFAGMKRGLFSGGQYGYDPATKQIFELHDRAEMPHLASLMGGPEMWFEMIPVVNDPKLTAMWLDVCKYLQAPDAEAAAALGNRLAGDRLGNPFAKMTAYAARELKDDKLADRAWAEFLGRTGTVVGRYNTRIISGPTVPTPYTELVNPGGGTSSTTNETAQWSLNAIELLDMIGDRLPPQK